jgi:hypothetical protein
MGEIEFYQFVLGGIVIGLQVFLEGFEGILIEQ